MRFLFAIALLGVVLAVAGCSEPTKAIDTKPPASGPTTANPGDKAITPP